MIDLSIVIVNWNTREDLLICLESLVQKGGHVSKEIFVIDNGSQDGSGKEVRKCFLNVHLIENLQNVGFARATNQGIMASSGRYLLLLNPDTQIKEGTLETLTAFMDAHPEAGVAGAQLLNSDGSKQNSIANFPSLATELLNKNVLRWFFPKTFPGKEKDYVGPLEVDSVIGACMIVRRQALDQVGPLDEDYFLFLEETDWCYRMKKVGWKVYHVPQAEIYHFQGRSAGIEREKAKIEYYQSRYLFFKKNRGRLQWFILLIGLVLRLWSEWFFMTLVCIFTFWVVKKWRKRRSVYAHLLLWHLRFCPEGMGLNPQACEKKYKKNDPGVRFI